MFSSKAKEPGTYTLRQLCTSVGKIQFVLLHIYPIVQYDVYSQEPQLKVEPTTGRCNCRTEFDEFCYTLLGTRLCFLPWIFIWDVVFTFSFELIFFQIIDPIWCQLRLVSH